MVDLDRLLTDHGIGLIELRDQVRRDGGDLADETAQLRAAVTLLSAELTARLSATQHLVEEHDQLRNRHAHTVGRMTEAHRVVSKAAVQHQDPKLAALARDTLHGFHARKEALEALPTGLRVYRDGFARLADEMGVELGNQVAALLAQEQPLDVPT